MDDFWYSLLHAIDDACCIPFVGAGASCPPLPTSSQLCERLCKRFCVPAYASGDLGKAAEFIQFSCGDRRELICAVEEELELKMHDRNEAHLNLAHLPWDILITTNYDAFISTGLMVAGKGSRIWNLLNQEHQQGSSIFELEPTEKQTLVVHLHGALPGDSEGDSDIVISESDYYRYLANMSSGVWSLPRTVLRALASSNYLFVGYSVRDWTFRLLFYSLQRFIDKKHFALVFLPDGSDDEEARYLGEYLQRFVRAYVFFGDAQSFTAELRERWDTFTKSGRAKIIAASI